MRIKKFDRIEPDERKLLLIKSAIRCLTREGYAGLSVRKITKEADVSQGLVNHHFGSINSLITCAYQDISNQFVESIRKQVDDCTGSAYDKLDMLFCCHFSEDQFEPELLKPWLVFWSLVKDSEHMAEAYEISNGKIEQIIRGLLVDISREENLENANIPLITQGLMALLDGLWARQCLSPENLSLNNALQICRNWGKGYRSGLFVDM